MFSKQCRCPQTPNEALYSAKGQFGQGPFTGLLPKPRHKGPPHRWHLADSCDEVWWLVPPQGNVLRERGNTQSGNVPVSHQPASTNNGRVNHTIDTIYGTDSENDDLHGQARPSHGCCQTCQAYHDNTGAEAEEGLGLAPHV